MSMPVIQERRRRVVSG